ncbi:hypothetical protein INR49_001145 [Caranx melampygus]|nr:hypothetical protein INR49_001145 [Caranx melampygus]
MSTRVKPVSRCNGFVLPLDGDKDTRNALRESHVLSLSVSEPADQTLALRVVRFVPPRLPQKQEAVAMVLEKKASARVEAGQRRVLDEATRQRRLSRQLEALEKDNFQDDPLSSLPPPGPTARLPAFSETEEPEKKKRKTRGDHFKQRFRKNFTTLLEEENLSEKPEPNYLSAAAPPSSLPPGTSAVSVVSPPTTPAPPVGGATAAAGVSEVDAVTGHCGDGGEGRSPRHRWTR